jgi:hypothetical protein
MIEALEALPWAIGITAFFAILWYICDPEGRRNKK